MADTTLLSSVILDLGISTAPDETKSLVNLDRVRANLPAVPETVPGANRLFADLIDLAASTDPDTDRSAARDRWRKRLVRDPGGNSIIRSVTFVPEIKKGIVHAVGYIDLPNPTDEDPNRTQEQKIVPLFYVGAQYLKQLEGNRYTSGDAFHCIVFAPVKKTDVYSVLPLGFADPKVINTWNEIAQRRNESMRTQDNRWQTISPIPHNLRKPSARTVSFIPTFDVSHLVSGSSKRQLMGTYFGQPIYLARRSEVPIPEVVDGVNTFTKPYTFLVKHLRENHLELISMGPSDQVTILPRFELDDVKSIMDPFEVLDSPPKKTNWKHIDKLTRKWLNVAFDDKNPLYVAALKLLLVYENDEPHTKRAILEDLWRSAVDQARLQMLEAEKQLRHMLEINISSKPSAQELWGQETSIDVLTRFLNEPVDAAAIWIERILDQPFDPKSPLHMGLRTWLINTHASVALSELPPPIPDLQTTVQQKPRELSRPAFRINEAFAQTGSPETDSMHHADTVELLIDDDLEEVIGAEETQVSEPPDEELSFEDQLAHDAKHRTGFYVKPGSILSMNSLQGHYRNK